MEKIDHHSKHERALRQFSKSSSITKKKKLTLVLRRRTRFTTRHASSLLDGECFFDSGICQCDQLDQIMVSRRGGVRAWRASLGQGPSPGRLGSGGKTGG